MDTQNQIDTNKAVVKKMWAALGAFDFDALTSCLHPEIFYEDVPTDDGGATGPEQVIQRLSVAWDHLSEQIQTHHHMAAEGDIVFLDHTERWIFKTGEVVEHRFATMHELQDGLITRWSDFWDVNKFVGQFPKSFLQVMIANQGDDFTSTANQFT